MLILATWFDVKKYSFEWFTKKDIGNKTQFECERVTSTLFSHRKLVSTPNFKHNLYYSKLKILRKLFIVVNEPCWITLPHNFNLNKTRTGIMNFKERLIYVCTTFIFLVICDRNWWLRKHNCLKKRNTWQCRR